MKTCNALARQIRFSPFSWWLFTNLIPIDAIISVVVLIMSLSLLLLLLLPLRFWPFRHLFVKRALFQFHFVAAGDAGASANDSVVVYWNSILCLSLVWDTLRFFALFPKKIQIGPDQPKHDRNFLPPTLDCRPNQLLPHTRSP